MKYSTEVDFVRLLGAQYPPPGDPDDAKYVTRFCDYCLPRERRGKVGLWQRIWQAAQRLADNAESEHVARAIRGHVMVEMSKYAESRKPADWWLKSFGSRRRRERPGWDHLSVDALIHRLAGKWYEPDHPVQVRARKLEAARVEAA